MTFFLTIFLKSFFAKIGTLAFSVGAACLAALSVMGLAVYKDLIKLKPKQFVYAIVYTACLVLLIFVIWHIKHTYKIIKANVKKDIQQATRVYDRDLSDKEASEREEYLKFKREKQKKEFEKRWKDQKAFIKDCLKGLSDKELYKGGGDICLKKWKEKKKAE